MREDETEGSAQGSLLQFYSSETTAHATYLLTFALIGAALLAIGKVLQPWFLLGALSLIFAFSVWTGIRILYWGTLANSIIYVNPRADKTMEAMHKATLRIAANERPQLFTIGKNDRLLTFLLGFGCFVIAAAILYWGRILTVIS
jgi:hypothetical protein